MKDKIIYILAAAVWTAVGAIGGYAFHPSSAPAPSWQETALPAANEMPAGIRINYIGAGMFAVPDQLTPGTYIVTATGNTFGCYWGRLKATDGKVKSIVDSGTVSRGGFGQFTVQRADKAVKLIGDCTWSRI